MRALAWLVLRITVGGLLAGHGAQKLFGWFGGYGLEGTRGWLKSLGMRPGWVWARTAGVSEFGGGVLTALGFMHPIGPLMLLGPMSIAIGKVHWGKPVWATEGGAELPVTNIAVGAALALAGPGRYSLDHLFGIRVPPILVALVAAGTAAGVAAGLTTQQEETQEETAGSELQGGQGASESPAAFQAAT